jgi:hypothetical protein
MFIKKHDGENMMRWLEVIKLRAAGNGEELLDELFRQMNNAGQDRGLVEIKTYRHAALETDLSLHLHWESERPEQTGSILGLRLAQALKEFGLIDHSIWIEEEK